MDASGWDERYAAAPLLWSAEPNALFANLVAGMLPGRALDLAAGEGRIALWLAGRGWRVTAVDFSRVALDKGVARAAAEGLRVDWVEADLTAYEPEHRAYDLVALLFLHLAAPTLRTVVRRAVASLAVGGTLVAIGHDRTNVGLGVGGPQDPDLLWDADTFAIGGPDRPRGLSVTRNEPVVRPTDAGEAIDRLVVVRRER